MALDDPSILTKSVSSKDSARTEHKIADMDSIESPEDLPNSRVRAAYPGDIPAGIAGLCYMFNRIQQAARSFAEGVNAFYCTFMMPTLDDDDSDYEDRQ